MLSIVAIILSVVSCVFGGASWTIYVKNRRKERSRIRRSVKASRRRVRRVLSVALAQHSKAVEDAVVDVVQKATAKHTHTILIQLQKDQRELGAKLAHWLRRTEKRQEIQIDLRLSAIEKHMAGVTGLIPQITARLKSFVSWGSKKNSQPEGEV